MVGGEDGDPAKKMTDAQLLADCLALQHNGGDVLARSVELTEEICARAEAQREEAKRLEGEWAQLKQERERFALERAAVGQLNAQGSDRVVLDIGVKTYTTTRQTLGAFPTSMLAAWFSGRHAIQTREDGTVFIDRSPVLFDHGLDFLHTAGECPLFFSEENGKERWRAEFDFYGIPWPEEPIPDVLDALQGRLDCVEMDAGVASHGLLEADVACGSLLTKAYNSSGLPWS